MDIEKYTGNKKIEGLYQWIINHIPKHETYFEPFAGSAAIGFILPDTAAKYITDCNTGTVAQLIPKFSSRARTDISVCDFRKAIAKAAYTVNTDFSGQGVFMYLDPPYLIESRLSKKALYQFELTVEVHTELIALLSGPTVKFNCMISHYEHPLYDALLLKGWRKESQRVCYNGKPVNECIYMNYPEPHALQTYMYLGRDCWDRQRIKRKLDKLERKLQALPQLERMAIIERINQLQ